MLLSIDFIGINAGKVINTFTYMRKYLGMVAIAVATQFLFSCSQEEEYGSSTTERGKIVAHINQPVATRTAVGDAVAGTNAVGIVWTDGDEIGVFDASGNAQKRYTKVGQGTAPTAGFAASGTTAFDTPVYAYYPYDDANSGKDMHFLTGTLPTVQTMDDGTLHGDYKYGRATAQTADGVYEFVFRHIFSLARIILDVSDTPLQGETLRSITVSASRGETGVPLAGGFTFDAENGDWSQTDEGQNGIMLQWNADAPTLGEPLTCYMSLFPLVKSGDLFTVTVTTDSHRAEFTTSSLTDFAAEQIYTFPMTLSKYGSLKVYDNEGTAVQGSFICAAMNVDGLPSLINSDGPGSDGTATLGNIINGLDYDIIAVSEDFEYHNQLSSALSNYNAGTYRGSVGIGTIFGKADTDGLCFFWKKDAIDATGETMVEFNDKYGDLTHGANELIAKGFRHYVVTVAASVTVDVYITHMNTFDGSDNTEANPYVSVQLSELRQLRDYVVERAKENNRPAIIMGDTNMRYTRHQIVDNLITPVESDGLQIADPWVELQRGDVYPQWNTPSLMIPSKFSGGEILCANDQRGEVVDKMWYVNVPGAPVQLKATSCVNDVEHFTKSTEQASYTGVNVEDMSGNIQTGQNVNYTKNIGYADHFPVVVSFAYTCNRGK